MQRYSKLAILGNLGMPGHTPKMIDQFEGISDIYLPAGKKSTLSVTFSSASFEYYNYLPSCQKSEKTKSHPDKNAELINGETPVIL